MKVFIDTNVWLAGRFGRGLCSDLLTALIDKDVDLLLDPRIFAEFKRIAQTKFGVIPPVLERAERFFREYAHMVPAATRPVPKVPDPDDAWIIAAALEARADLFVTGDKALLALGEVQDLPIRDPRATYLRLRGLE